MTITTQDVKLYQAQRNTDAADGGGRMGGVEVVDGVLNNLFTNISRLDKLFGKTSYRKAFLGAFSANRDIWQGVHAFLTDPPADPDIDVVIFAAASDEEVRSAAAARVEPWMLARSVVDPALGIVGTHPAGAVNVLMVAAATDYGPGALPSWPGNRFCLRVVSGGQLGQQQICKYRSVSVQVVTPPGSDDSYSLLNYQLDAPLAFSFPGASEDDYSTVSPTRLYEVSVATPLARDVSYYGVSALAEAASVGASSMVAARSTAKLAPAAVSQPALVGIDPTNLHPSRRVPIFRPGNGVVIHNTAQATLTNPVVAGSTYSLGRTFLSYAVVRDSAGVRIPSDRYSVNYDAGTITMANPLTLAGYTQPLVVTHMVEDRAVIVSMPETLGDASVLVSSAQESDTLLDLDGELAAILFEFSADFITNRTQSEAAGVYTLTGTDTRSNPDTAFSLEITVDMVGGTAVLTSSDAPTGIGLDIHWARAAVPLSLDRPLTRNYTTSGTHVSTVLALGDLEARAFNLFSQQAWSGAWSDAQIGAGTSGQYNAAAFPIVVTNAGAIAQRWRIEFTSGTAFRVVGEFAGQVAIGTINADLAPINPATGAPYFTIHADGWGTGWNAGNVVRFSTTACAGPLWFIRATQPGPDTEPTDRVKVLLRGDAN